MLTAAETAWIYDNVLIGYHDANETNWWCGPEQDEDLLRQCACQLGEQGCTWCRSGQHKRCRELAAQEARFARQGHAAEDWDSRPRPPWRPIAWGPETTLRVPASWLPTRKRPLAIGVWLADRVCRYLCGCTTCNPPEPARAPLPEPAAVPLLVDGEQLDLFAGVTA